MKCLHCGKKLALLRKLTDREFCSESHRRLHEQAQEKLALSRLRDAQKQLAAYSKPEEPKAGPPVIPPVDFSTRRENEVGSFLPQAPLPVALKGYRPIDMGDVIRVVSEILPEREFGHAAGLQPALAEPWAPKPRPLEIPPRECTEAALGFAWQPACPAGSAMRMEFRGIPVAAGVELIPVTPVAREIAAARVAEAEQNLPPNTIIAVPYIALDRLPEMASQGPVKVAQAARTPEKAQHPVAEPQSEPFQRRPAVSRHNELTVQNETSAVSAEQMGDEPGLAEMVPGPRPKMAERRAALRRVRPRELFFPLPRLGHLPSLAAQVAGNTVSAPRYQGTRGKRWLPDRVPMSFRLAIADNGRDGGADPFGWLAMAEGRHPGMVSRQAQVTGTGLPLAGETGLDYLLDGEGLPADPRQRQALIEAIVPEAEKAPGVPASGLGLTGTALLSSQLQLDALAVARAGVPMVHTEPERETAPQATPQFCLKVAAAAACGASHAIAPCAEMVQIRLTVPSAGKEGCAVEPELAEVAAIASGDKLSLNPKSQRAGEFQMLEENAVFPLEPSLALHRTYHSPAQSELLPLWADLPKLLPQSPLSVLEDSEMREAARALSAEMALQKRGSWFSGLHLPQISMQVSRGDLKWLMMSVPVVLLLGVYTLTEKGATVGVSHLPPVDREVMESAAEAVPEQASNEKPAVAPAKTELAGTVRKPAAPAASAKPIVTAPEPAVPVAASSTQPASLTPAVNNGIFGGIRQTILRRAAISMADDFRSGLGDWEGKGDWSRHWDYDAAGFLRTGPLALYKPSLALTDYQMEFLAQIEKKSISWVFRAADLNNYHAAKVAFLREGPLARAVVEHWAVIDGKETPHVRRPVPFQLSGDSFYRFRMAVAGNGFTLSIQGQVADHWSDDRLKVGGIGFFSGKGEQARLRWVEISHQYDFLGRVCAFLAPYGIPGKDMAAR